MPTGVGFPLSWVWVFTWDFERNGGFLLRPRSLFIALSLSYRVPHLLLYHCTLLISHSVLYVYHRPVYTGLCGLHHPLSLLGQYALQAKPHLPILDIIPTHIPGPPGRVTQ